MLEYISIKITTPEIVAAVTKYSVPYLEYEEADYLLYDTKMKTFIIEEKFNVDLDLLLPTLELFEEALLLLGLGLTLNEIKEKLLD